MRGEVAAIPWMGVQVGDDDSREGLTAGSPCVRDRDCETDAAANARNRAGAYKPRARRTAILMMSDPIAHALRISLTLLLADS